MDQSTSIKFLKNASFTLQNKLVNSMNNVTNAYEMEIMDYECNKQLIFLMILFQC